MHKSLSSNSSLIAVLIASITSVWIYLISDNPVKIVISLIIGICSGIVAFFVLTNRTFTVQFNNPHLPTGKLLLVAFLLFLVTYFISPVGSIFVVNWFSVPLVNWLSLVLSLFFTFFASGFIIINLLGVYGRVPFSISVVLSVLISLFVTSVLWFFSNFFSLSEIVSFGFFALFQFVAILAYFRKVRSGSSKYDLSERKSFSLDIIFPLAAIIVIFVSLVILQEFVFVPFVRGDSWVYVGNAVAISKGLFHLVPDGLAIMGPPHFFETFLSALTGFSGFPLVNSLLLLSIVLAVLVPLTFYTVCLKYSENSKVSTLSTFVFVVVSGFGWLPLVIQKFGFDSSFLSTVNISDTIYRFAPKVLNDITQPQGVFPEGIKTYGFGLLAVFILLYFFRSDLPSKARATLIAIVIAFAFQYHIEEAIVFALAFIPAFLVLSKNKTSLRVNLAGLSIGLGTMLVFNVLFSRVSFGSGIFDVLSASLIILGLYIAFTFVKIDVIVNQVKSILKNSKVIIFLVLFYFYALAIYVLISYGYPNMTTNYSFDIVSVGVAFPWYYYPMALGVVGVLLLVGFLYRFEKNTNITLFLLISVFLFIFGVLLSVFNENVFFTTTKEWRIVYRMLPVPASVFAGWVLFKLINVSESKMRTLRFSFRKKIRVIRVNSYSVFAVALLSVIILGIPSTVIASEYWMSSGVGPHGNLHPDTADIELANFFSHVPVSSKVAVAEQNSNSDALVQLGGCLTDTYPNLAKLDRPETISLLSSNDRYLLLDKTQGFNQTDFSVFENLPVEFNNSKYLVYELPKLRSPSLESSIGYVAPLQYNNMTLPSYFVISSLNLSYQLVNDDVYGKSVLLLPLEPPGQLILQFNGVDQDVDLGNFSLTSNEFSVSAWFKTSVSGSDMSIVNDRVSGALKSGYRIMILSSNVISAEVNDGNGTISVTGGVHDDGLWHNVVSVLDQKYLLLYVDGKLEGATVLSRPLKPIINDLNMTLGSEEGKAFFFNGSISSVCIYDRVLTLNETAPCSLTFHGYVSKNGLSLWLPVNEGTGDQLYDGLSNSSIGTIHGAAWGFENVPSDVNYGMNEKLILNWVQAGGKLVAFGGRGETNSALELNDTGPYVAVNSIESATSNFQLNRTISIASLTYPATAQVLGYYTSDGQNICPFAIEEKYGEGSVLYFYLDPVYNISKSEYRSIIFDSNFLEVINQTIDNWGVTNYLKIDSEDASVIDYSVNQFFEHQEKNFTAQGIVDISSSLSGSYLVLAPFSADTLRVNQHSSVISVENLTINKVNVYGNAELKVRTGDLVSTSDKNSIPTYFEVKFDNCSVTLKPDELSSVEVETNQGLFTVNSGESVSFDSKMALMEIRNPSITINGNTTLTQKTSSTLKYKGETQMDIVYNDNHYLFFGQLVLPISDSNYPQQYALPWTDVLLSPFNIVLIFALVLLGIKFRNALKHDDLT
jgi:hypothetical protein